MKIRFNLKKSFVKLFTVLSFVMLLLVGCTQVKLNIEPDSSYLADDLPGKLSDDYYIVSYGNMVNLEAATKHQLTEVFSVVSNIQLNYGLYDQALITINRGLEFSDDVDLFMSKLKIYDQLNDSVSRTTLIEQMIIDQGDRYPSMSFKDKMNFNNILINSNYGEQAIEHLFKLLETNISNSDSGLVFSQIGLAYFFRNDFENGKFYSERALDFIPGDSDTLLNLGGCYQSLGDFEAALTFYDQVLQSSPDNTDAIYRCATTAYELKNYNLAGTYFSRYVELMPYDIEGWSGYYISTEDLEVQKKCINQLVSLAPDVRNYAYKQLIIEQNMGNLSDPYEVTEAYQKATSPFDAQWLIADFTYHYLSREDGVSLYKELIENFTLSFTEYLAFVENICGLEDSVLLAQVLSQVEKAYGKEYRLILEADVSYKIADANSLMNAAKQIIKINPKNGYGYEYLGDAYYFNKDYGNAVSNYLLAVQYREDTYNSSKSLIECLILLERVEQAETLSEQFLIDYPNDALGYVNHARIKMKKMIVESAAKHLATAMTLSNNLKGIFELYEELAPLKDRPEFRSIVQ